MAIEAIAAIGAPQATAATSALPTAALSPLQEPSTLFSTISDQIATTDQRIQAADQSVRSLAAGEIEDLHGVMLDLEKAKLSLSLVVQVRNRLLESYQEVMRMQL